jgi:hypothetical protein
MADKMTQIKFTIESCIVSSFKARCASEGVSMTSEIRQFMGVCKPVAFAAIKAHTRPLRRKAVEIISGLLKDILLKEEEYRDVIPEQFTQRYEIADQACECLSDAIELLEEAFN